MLKVLFFGTPQVAVPFLERLIPRTSVVGVVCRPDEPVGRGYTLTPPPVKVAAQKHNLPVFQPQGPWTPDTIDALKRTGADLGVIVAYGRILPRDVFAAPRLGSVNVHFSLLPKFRGASPIQSALIEGETETGVSIFWLEEGLDSGPLFSQVGVSIAPEDGPGSLREKLVSAGLDLLDQMIEKIEAGKIERTPQADGTNAPIAPLISKGDRRIHWQSDARRIANRIRGLSEAPVATTTYTVDGNVRTLKVYKAAFRADDKPGVPNLGVIEGATPEGIMVRAVNGTVIFQEVQPEGKKRMPAWAFWQGSRLQIGDRFE